jgi:aconitate decarboxylase
LPSPSLPFDAVEAFAAHIARTRLEDLPAQAIAKAKTFLLDTIGVGLAGTSDGNAGRVLEAAGRWGAGTDATVWGSAVRLPAPSAAFVNAYLVHCLEYDCIHEPAVVHPMATLIGALFAWCERASLRGRPVDGRRFLTAMSVGVDVAGLMGGATKSGLTFFRPATAGGFGAAAGLASLAGFDAQRVKDTLGLQLAQASGTMQAHVEGSPALGLQVGFNARAALCAADAAAAGLAGPHDFLAGQFGYFALFEGGSFDPAVIERELGRVPQITRISHKPWPSGRLTHGGVDGVRQLMRTHDFSADAIATITIHVPPLVMSLVGRPDVPDPTSNYAKLCLPFVVGTYLARGRVDVPDFAAPELRNDPEVHAYASRVRVVMDANPDQNAIVPQRVVMRLNDGAEHAIVIHAIHGHPDAALTEMENLDKFTRNCGYARNAVAAELRQRVVGLLAEWEEVADVAVLTRMLAA